MHPTATLGESRRPRVPSFVWGGSLRRGGSCFEPVLSWCHVEGCRELGYEFGVRSQTPCGEYGAANLRGPPGSPVAAQSLSCTAGELSITECTWSTPAGAGHEADTVVFCGSSAAGAAEGPRATGEGGA